MALTAPAPVIGNTFVQQALNNPMTAPTPPSQVTLGQELTWARDIARLPSQLRHGVLNNDGRREAVLLNAQQAARAHGASIAAHHGFEVGADWRSSTYADYRRAFVGAARPYFSALLRSRAQAFNPTPAIQILDSGLGIDKLTSCVTAEVVEAGAVRVFAEAALTDAKERILLLKNLEPLQYAKRPNLLEAGLAATWLAIIGAGYLFHQGPEVTEACVYALCLTALLTGLRCYFAAPFNTYSDEHGKPKTSEERQARDMWNNTAGRLNTLYFEAKKIKGALPHLRDLENQAAGKAVEGLVRLNKT